MGRSETFPTFFYKGCTNWKTTTDLLQFSRGGRERFYVCVLRTKWGKNYKWSVSVSFYWQEVGSFCLILLLNVFVGLVIFLAFTSSGYGKVVFVFRGNSLPCLLFGFSFTIIHDSQDSRGGGGYLFNFTLHSSTSTGYTGTHINRTITAYSSPLHIRNCQTRTGNLCFTSASR